MSNIPTFAKPLTETQIQKQITDWLSHLQIFHLRLGNKGEIFGSGDKGFIKESPAPGMPDILVLINGNLIWLEVKRPGKHMSDVQKEFAKCARANGAIVAEVHSVSETEAVIQPIYLKACSIGRRPTPNTSKAFHQNKKQSAAERALDRRLKALADEGYGADSERVIRPRR